MKKRNLFLLVALGLLSTLNANAQTNVTSSGMSIQGIARDETNSAISNVDQLDLVFTVYYLGIGNSEQAILTKSANVKTDNFGVFSYVLDIDQIQYNQISNQSTYLKVMQGSVVFSNEKLQAVPYAIFAQNGVPTGSIMPFIGAVAPNGWLLCNGSTFVDNANTANLKALLGGTTTPNLNGMFLRGTGTAASGKVGPALKAVQEDAFEGHGHSYSSTTGGGGAHNHSFGFGFKTEALASGGKADMWGSGGGSGYNGYTSSVENHTHSVSGNTNTTGGTETRPINYGVNYIIKI